MIKFFRKIRQKLLSQNRFTKYLIYALGEIVLVMIGILLALQVNNWNEQNARKKKLHNYLNALETELTSNITLMERAAQRAKEDYMLCIKLVEQFNAKQTHEYTSNDIYKRVGPIFKVEMLNSVFTDMISSGVLENLEDQELKKKIFRIALYQENYDNTFENASKIWENYMLPYSHKHANVIGLWDSINQVKLPQPKFENDIEAFVNNRYYTNLLSSRARLIANVENISLSMKDNFELIVKEIENYLQK